MENIDLASSIRTVVSKFHRRLLKLGRFEDNLSLTELGTLGHLYRNKVNYPSELAALVMVKAQSMSQILNTLEEQNMIVKTPSESDKRKIAISLSEHGREWVEQSRHVRDEWLANNIEKSLTAKQIDILAEAITIMDKLADAK